MGFCCSCSRFVRWLLGLIVEIFFSEHDAFNEAKVPAEGATIFVCAPHANQFMDPLLVAQHVPRPVSFLAAKKSCDRKYVGKLIMAMGSIPVKRPQDYMSKADGKATAVGKRVVGEGTRFTAQFKDRASIFFKNGQQVGSIARVVSDTELELAEPLDADVTAPCEIKVVPYIDQSQVFEHVWEELRRGGCVGIFPEGGSHDRTSMLPLKAGFCIMALGAMAKFPELSIRIVPCGLNYFHAHRFRSHAYVDFGDPVEVPRELADKYKAGKDGKREAIADLLKQVYHSLRAVTVNVQDFHTLQLIRLVRRLYNPPSNKLTVAQKLVLTRRFGEAYEKYKDRPEVQALLARVEDYSHDLKHHQLKDYQVMRTATDGCRSGWLLLWRVLKLVVLTVLALPGLLLYSPVACIASHISAEKAREAKAGSAVKVAGRDVLATWKVLVAMVLLPLFTLLWVGAAAILVSVVWDPEPLWIHIVVPIGVLLLLPPLSFFTVRFSETALQILYSLRPLLLATCKCCCERGVSLRQKREELSHMVQDLVNKLGPEFLAGGDVDKFQQMRLVKLVNDHRSAATSTADADADDEKAPVESATTTTLSSAAAAPASQQLSDEDDSKSERVGALAESSSEMGLLSPRVTAASVRDADADEAAPSA
jgi:glycerol-3-phosphate O-acyltransferase/dihydroxyacetone phosphate acyltransferase